MLTVSGGVIWDFNEEPEETNAPSKWLNGIYTILVIFNIVLIPSIIAFLIYTNKILTASLKDAAADGESSFIFQFNGLLVIGIFLATLVIVAGSFVGFSLIKYYEVANAFFVLRGIFGVISAIVGTGIVFFCFPQYIFMGVLENVISLQLQEIKDTTISGLLDGKFFTVKLVMEDFFTGKIDLTEELRTLILKGGKN